MIPNRDIFASPLEILNGETGYEAKRIFVKDDGQRTMVEMLSRDDFRAKDAPKTEVYKKRIILENSYDTTTAMRILFGAWRLICRNGAGLWLTKALEFSIIHMGVIDLPKMRKGIVKAIEAYDVAFNDHLQNVTELSRRSVRTGDIDRILLTLKIGKYTAQRVIENLYRDNIQKSLTMLSVYNAVTQYMRDSETKGKKIMTSNLRRSAVMMNRLLATEL